MTSQFICDNVLNYLENGRQILFQMGDLSERANFPLTIYQLATVSIQLIGKKKEYY
jgi:hypothetical protein